MAKQKDIVIFREITGSSVTSSSSKMFSRTSNHQCFHYNTQPTGSLYNTCLLLNTLVFAVSDLDSGAGVEHDVFDGALNVLRPRHQPCDFVVMTNFLPPGAGRRFRVNRISENRQWMTITFTLKHILQFNCLLKMVLF